jgi:hypothetical protein
MAATNYKPGEVVRFCAVIDADDAARRMVVVEDRDDRVLVQLHPSDSAWRDVRTQPTHVYLKSDICLSGGVL